MGCDIHAFIEVKEYDLWWEWAKVNINRNYTLFGLMAGVRIPEYKLFDARGVPSDVSDGARIEHIEWGTDAHHPSWLSLIEIKSVYGEFEHIVGGRNRDALAVMQAMDALSMGYDDVRIVFWFDN